MRNFGVLQSGIRAQVYRLESSLGNVVIQIKSLKPKDLRITWRMSVGLEKKGRKHLHNVLECVSYL